VGQYSLFDFGFRVEVLEANQMFFRFHLVFV